MGYLFQGGVQVCQVRVYDQPWTGVRKIQSFQCGDDSVDSGPAPTTEPVMHDNNMPGGKHKVHISILDQFFFLPCPVIVITLRIGNANFIFPKIKEIVSLINDVYFLD